MRTDFKEVKSLFGFHVRLQKIENQDFKSKSGFPNRTQPKENSSLLVYVLHKM